MSKVSAIWRRELRSYWNSPTAYILIVVFLLVISWIFFRLFFIQNNAELMYMGWLPAAFAIMLPALTMRQWAEERSSGTLEMLMTKPVREWDAVLGKFLAGTTMLLAILAFTIPLVVTVALLSQNGLDPGVVFTSYLGALLLGMSMLAIGQWVSSVTANQVVALILSWFMIAALIVVGEAMVTFFAAGSLTPVLEYIGLNRHYVSMARGVIDTRDLLYYFSVIFLFLYLTTRAVESRKWS
jgi:ABC-2 type transport system permease protein